MRRVRARGGLSDAGSELVLVKPSWEILLGDAWARLSELPANRFHCVVTSHPYWGLRDYGVDGQIGLEETPEEFIDKLVEVYAQVQRVMRPDATLWVNAGDSYSSDGGCPTQGKTGVMRGRAASASREAAGRSRVASRRTWSANPGCSRSRSAIGWGSTSVRRSSGKSARPCRSPRRTGLRGRTSKSSSSRRASATTTTPSRSARTRSIPRARERRRVRRSAVNARPAEYAIYSGKRNKRSVWTLGPEPSATPHFATFPTKLVEPCLLAGTSEKGACEVCGTPWRRQLSKPSGGAIGASWLPHSKEGDAEKGNFKVRSSEGYKPAQMIGWEAACECGGGAGVVPCSVLDPFAGTATTGVVALRLGRSFVGVELSPKYAQVARDRLERTAAELATPLFERAAGPATGAAS